MKRFVLMTMAAALCGGAAAAGSDYDAIREAAMKNDLAKTESVCAKIDIHDGDPAANYLAAYCQYRIAYAAMARIQEPAVKARAQQALERASDLLEKSADVQGAMKAENLALLSLTYGTRIGLDGSLGASLGRKAWEAVATAEAIAPDNPRVLLAKAGNLMHTPPMFGGDLQKAAAALEKAKQAYPARPPADNWGLEDVYMNLAVLHAGMKQTDAARAEIRQVLAMNPDHGWAKYQLSLLH